MTTTSNGNLVRLLFEKPPAADGAPSPLEQRPHRRKQDFSPSPRKGVGETSRRRGSAILPGNGDHSGMDDDGSSRDCGNTSLKNAGRNGVVLPPRWTVADAAAVAKRHPLPCALFLSVLFFMGVEYTLSMVPSRSPPLDVGFVLTAPLNRLLAARPALNSALAALNTAFVAMQAAYILGTLVLEGRPRATVSALFMFTCRGILGYSTQLPLPDEFLGSGADFPVANVSFFLFFSGHVAGSVIASLDMRRTGRRGMAALFDALNLLQVLRLLATRGHYTIDLAAGVGAGFLFDVLAGRYEKSRGGSPRKLDTDRLVRIWRPSRGCSYEMLSPAVDNDGKS